MSLDQFFNRRYDEANYNCAHFVAEVWEHVTGQDLRGQFDGFLLPPKNRFVRPAIRRGFVKLEKPTKCCIVVFHKLTGSAHVGIYINGNVLHIQRIGVRFQPLELAILGFKTYRFYDVKKIDHC